MSVKPVLIRQRKEDHHEFMVNPFGTVKFKPARIYLARGCPKRRKKKIIGRQLVPCSELSQCLLN